MKKLLRPLSLVVILVLVSCQSTPPSAEGQLYSESHLEFKKWNRDPQTCCEAKGRKIAIASGGPFSSAAGLKISEAGGNIIDVAVAVSLALNVERPQSTSLGGGGFMLLRLAGKKGGESFVDFRETAPRKVKTEQYLDQKGQPIPRATIDGGKAVATPGMVAGLYDIHKKWGKLPWAVVVQPAVDLARQGFPIYPSLAEKMEARKAFLAQDAYTKSLLFTPDGELKKLGQILTQADLAESLEQLARQGKAVFYSGKIGQAIAKTVQVHGGVLDVTDLKDYCVRFREPIRGAFKEYTFLTAPPPSAGGVFLSEVLEILSAYDLKAMAGAGVPYVHLVSEAMKRGYADRSDLIGDPDTLPPARRKAYAPLLTAEYAQNARTKINLERATPASEIRPTDFLPKETHGTTHASFIDEEGNSVAVTLTLNIGNFGAGVAVPGTGVFLNNEMDDFTLLPGKANSYGLVSSGVNGMAPKRRPVSSMTPTLVFRGDQPVLALGGAGGSKIISSVLNVFLNTLVVYDGDLRRAIYAPRAHHQWLPDKLDLEKGFTPSMRSALEARGYVLTDPEWVAAVEAVYRSPDGLLTAVYDPRNLGGATAR